jgi:2-(1,2-epoxy-1,2-dihydrophenyl)acetyl-CoA isomerase
MPAGHKNGALKFDPHAGPTVGDKSYEYYFVSPQDFRAAMQKAKELIFFGDDLKAAEAERVGLVNKVVPQAELMTAAGEWAGRLAESPTKAIMLSKWLLNRSLDSNRHGEFEDEAWAQEMASYTQDFQEGVAAFKERRDVEYRGW